MKKVLSVLALAFLVSMMTASASEIEITSPAAGETYYIWDDVSIEYDSTLGEDYIYTTFVNGIQSGVFAPEKYGKYIIKVLGENPGCEDCPEYTAKRTINVGYYPNPEQTKIEITSPVLGSDYHVGENVTIEFESPLKDRDGFIFNTYVTDPNGVSKKTKTWAPTGPGRYGIRVEAVGKGFKFSSSNDYIALAPE